MTNSVEQVIEGRKPIEPALRHVEPARRAECAIDEINASRAQWKRLHPRPRSLTAREALMVLQFESTVVAAAAGSLSIGEVLNEADFDRLSLAKMRINTIIDEAIG